MICRFVSSFNQPAGDTNDTSNGVSICCCMLSLAWTQIDIQNRLKSRLKTCEYGKSLVEQSRRTKKNYMIEPNRWNHNAAVTISKPFNMPPTQLWMGIYVSIPDDHKSQNDLAK